MTKSHRFPPVLKRGTTIGIVAPARWPKPEWIKKGRALLEKQGYRVVVHSQCFKKDGQLAGSDKVRAKALMEMFCDPKIDAIICARGGTGSVRIVDLLDYKLIKKHPKIFCGFSDITALLQAISRKCGFVTYHGPMLWNFAVQNDAKGMKDFVALTGSSRARSLKVSGIKSLKVGSAEGVLTGGNITLLEYLMGTEFDWDTRDKILFIEDVDEPLYKIDAKLRHFKLAGRFKNVRAVIVGEMVDVSDGETGYMRKGEKPYGRTLEQILREVLPAVPVCMHFPCGHGKYLTTLPIGARVRLSLKKDSAELIIQRP